MIRIYWAPPRQGKSFCVTAEHVAQLLEGKRTIYTNYPIVVKTTDGRYLAPFIWKPELIHQAIVCADITIDEAYIDYSSREYKKFSVDQHTFFATNGHNDLNINLIVQNPARVDLVIREMCSEFIYVKKTAFPAFLWTIYAEIQNRFFKGNFDPSRPRPLYFTLYSYLTEKQMASMNPDDAWQVSRVWFSQVAASAYDTHYYRTQKTPYQGESWLIRFEVPESAGLPTTKTRRQKIDEIIEKIRGTVAQKRQQLKEKSLEYEKSCHSKWIIYTMSRLNREMRFPSFRQILKDLKSRLPHRIMP